MIDLSNKTYKNNKTGEVIKVIDSFENVVILENKQKIDISQLTNPELFTEQIDPSSFFNNQNAYNSLAEKIKNIPVDQIRDDESSEVIINIDGDSSSIARPAMNESAIIISSEDDERAELARKYGIDNNSNGNINPANDSMKQNEAFAKLLGEDSEDLPVIPKQVVNQPVRNEYVSENTYSQPQTKALEDPIITMFKNVKRTKDFSISLNIDNKIPRPDFIEMMEDSYNTSIIDYLAEEFTNDILKNPKKIEDMIRQRIKEIVYGVEKKNIVNQIDESNNMVDEQKLEPKKSTRKPKPNTDQGEKGSTRGTRTKKEIAK